MCLTIRAPKSPKYTLRARQTKQRLVLDLADADTEYPPVTVDFRIHPSKINAGVDLNRLCEVYESLRPEPHEQKLWTFWARLKKPVVISLDRALSAEIGDEPVFLEEMALHRTPRRIRGAPTDSPLTPIAKVKQVTTKRYAEYAARTSELNERLKAKIVMSAFRTPLASRQGTLPTLTLQLVERLEKKVMDLVSPSTKGEQERAQIANYFGQAKRYLKQGNTQEKSLELFAAQYSQIEALADAFDEFDRESANAYEPLRKYLATINSFFEDSGKTLGFIPSQNALAFSTAEASGGGVADQHRDIEWLSSGERQVLVLFTFLAFVAAANSIFIIDEPELSLHPKWQLEFLDGLLGLKEPGTQLLLATHSPEIVAKHKECCILLKHGVRG